MPHNPMNDIFGADIPDPTQVRNVTRDTMTLHDVLKQPRPTTSAVNTGGFMFGHNTGQRSHDNSHYESTPAKGRIIKAQKLMSPNRQSIAPGTMVGGPSTVQAMNHGYLNHRSEVFMDDTFESVEKRCFLLLCGKQVNEAAITIDIGINAFDDPRIKKNLQLNLVLDHLIVEYNNEILKSLTNLGLEYKVLTRFSDLLKAPGPTKINKHRNLWRMIEL